MSRYHAHDGREQPSHAQTNYDVIAPLEHGIGLMKTRKNPSKNIVTFAQSSFPHLHLVPKIGTIFPE